MRFIHTSDWHLGKTLYGESRREEMHSFFSFLKNTIIEQNVELLIVSGDIFDTQTPSSEAKTDYYDFLVSLLNTPCKDVVIVAGNHDSPSVLNEARNILEKLNIHVYTSVENLEPLVLKNRAIILPIPYPRESEIKTYISGEDESDSNSRYKKSIQNIYSTLIEKAKSLNLNLPIIATGHLVINGTKYSGEDKNEKCSKMGGLEGVNLSSFLSFVSYTALGHIHSAQCVDKKNNIYYSGSPIPFTFEEARFEKFINFVEINSGKTSVTKIKVPNFKSLYSVKGSGDEIISFIEDLISSKKSGYVLVTLTSSLGKETLHDRIDALLSEYKELSLSQIINEEKRAQIERDEENLKTLDELTPREVFKMLLDEKDIDRKDELIKKFDSILAEV